MDVNVCVMCVCMFYVLASNILSFGRFVDSIAVAAATTTATTPPLLCCCACCCVCLLYYVSNVSHV